MRRIPQYSRDWRIRTLVPVIAVNMLIFALLYGVMYHFAVSNLVKTERAAGSVLLDEIELDFPDMMHDPSGTRVRARMNREAAVHNLAEFNIFDSIARPVVTTYDVPPPEIVDAVRSMLSSRDGRTEWIIAPGNRTLLVAIRPLANRPACNECHVRELPHLGALQMSIDMTSSLKAAVHNVRNRFAIAGVAWIGILALMFWAGGRVIGRPLRKIQDSLRGAPDAADEQDLEALAKRVHERVWTTIEQQRTREEDIARHMARAQQLAALGEVAAGLTHEIKNPLAGVIATLDIMRMEEDADREILDQMLNELARVTGTLDTLLRFGRPQPPQRREVDLGRVVRDLSTIFQARFRRQGVELQIQTDDELLTLQLDAAMMAQLIVNLLTNALQATARGGTVSVFVTPFPQRDGVALVVADTGIGISSDNLLHIFDPFFTTKDDGTGLGLAICRQIVTQHGGSISIESEIGKGTRVIVLLPDTHAKELEESHGVAAAG